MTRGCLNLAKALLILVIAIILLGLCAFCGQLTEHAHASTLEKPWYCTVMPDHQNCWDVYLITSVTCKGNICYATQAYGKSIKITSWVAFLLRKYMNYYDDSTAFCKFWKSYRDGSVYSDIKDCR